MGGCPSFFFSFFSQFFFGPWWFKNLSVDVQGFLPARIEYLRFLGCGGFKAEGWLSHALMLCSGCELVGEVLGHFIKATY